MSLKKRALFTISFISLFLLVACGDKNKSKSQNEINAACTEIDCLSSVNWKILLRGQSFPEKVRLDVNGTTVLNECVSKQKYYIDRSSDPEMLLLENYYIPKRGQLKIELYDLRGDCGSEEKIISNDDVSFELDKFSNDSEIVINL
jgi:hypothetical protein